MAGWLFVGGSRSFADEEAVARVVRWCAARGFGVVTGCARGADALAVRLALAHGVPVRVFCVADVPAWSSGSALAEGVAWAGGGPRVPFRGRLARRTAAGVAWCAANGGVGGVVFFAGAPSPGSALTVRLLKKAGLPVKVFGLPADDTAGQPALALA